LTTAAGSIPAGVLKHDTVLDTSDASGNWAYYTQYKPFGQEYGTLGSWSSLKYTGQWRDANTGLYYLYRRFYDPALGRFLSPDPILGHLTVPQSLDRYVYTVNNPLRYVDLTEEDWWNTFFLIGVGALKGRWLCPTAQSDEESEALPTTSPPSRLPRARLRGGPDPP